MSYIEQNLSPGENVFYQTRLHWIVMIGPCLVALLAVVLGGGLLSEASTIHDLGRDAQEVAGTGIGLLVVGALIVAIASWRRSAPEMAVTNRRVLVAGWVHKSRSFGKPPTSRDSRIARRARSNS